MTPGPIALNAATFVGTRIAGVWGSLVATLGCILPSCVIVSVMALIYAKYKEGRMMQGILSTLRPAVVALIASAGFSILMQVIFPTGVSALANVNWFGVILASVAFFLLRKFRLNPIAAISLCGAVGLAYGLIFPA
ncbi:MAG: chromate transporter, partial [Oscillospiraceae bacterium]|nr:chromate transporter [Oscillospiraceae bacterium]